MTRSVAIVLLVAVGCGGRDGGEGKDAAAGQLTGVVLDMDGAPIAGATVERGGDDATTDANGSFTLATDTAPESRVDLDFSAAGFFDKTVGTLVPEQGAPHVQVVLLPRDKVGEFDADDGGEVENDDLWLSFPAGAFEAADGSPMGSRVHVFATYTSPDDDDFGSSMPGGDFKAEDADGEDGVLTSFGAIAVEAEDENGLQLALVAGTTGQACQRVPDSMRAIAPETLPVWVLDSDGVWIEAGTATLEGERYCWDMGQLGRHNCDIFARTGLLYGKVCDELGVAMANTPVSIHQYITSTTDNGDYLAIVPSQTEFDASAAGTTVSVDPLGNEEQRELDLGCDEDGGGGPGDLHITLDVDEHTAWTSPASVDWNGTSAFDIANDSDPTNRTNLSLSVDLDSDGRVYEFLISLDTDDDDVELSSGFPYTTVWCSSLEPMEDPPHVSLDYSVDDDGVYDGTFEVLELGECGVYSDSGEVEVSSISGSFRAASE